MTQNRREEVLWKLVVFFLLGPTKAVINLPPFFFQVFLSLVIVLLLVSLKGLVALYLSAILLAWIREEKL